MLYSDNLSHIKSINYDVYSFLKSNDLLSLPDGLYELNDYSYCVVETFKGRSSKSSKYEFSSECLTIYIVVEGQEVIEVRQKKDSVSVCFGDHTQQRTTSYSSEFIDGKYLLKPGRFLFF